MHQVFRMDSSLGALLGFFVVLPAIVAGLISLWTCVINQNFRGHAARIGKTCGGILASYIAVAAVVAALTPRTVVSVGDGYCWDLWCASVEQVNALSDGTNVRYTARVKLFSDADRVSTSRAKDFLSVVDDQGRRFPVFQDSGAAPLNVAFGPKDTVETSLSFVAPSNAKKLYLTGDQRSAPWVYLYLGSDLNPLHPRTLLRIL